MSTIPILQQWLHRVVDYIIVAESSDRVTAQQLPYPGWKLIYYTLPYPADDSEEKKKIDILCCKIVGSGTNKIVGSSTRSDDSDEKIQDPTINTICTKAPNGAGNCTVCT